MLCQIDVQPGREALRLGQHCGVKLGQRHPASIGHLCRIGSQQRAKAGRGQKLIDNLMLDQPLPDVGAVFDRTDRHHRQTGNPQFLLQPAPRAIVRRFVPFRMGAAGVGPQTRRVVFAQVALLQQDVTTVGAKDRDRLVPQIAPMHLQLFDLLQRTAHPGRDHVTHDSLDRTQDFNLGPLTQRRVKARLPVGMTSRAQLVNPHQKTIPVAVDPHLDQPLPMARGFALYPKTAA